MKVAIVQQAIDHLQTILSKNTDLLELSFFDGIFNVLATLELEGILYDEIFEFYLSDFLREGGVSRINLEIHCPELLENLEMML